jgi:hypothetical protein
MGQDQCENSQKLVVEMVKIGAKSTFERHLELGRQLAKARAEVTFHKIVPEIIAKAECEKMCTEIITIACQNVTGNKYNTGARKGGSSLLCLHTQEL